jgi:hypothetical protein
MELEIIQLGKLSMEKFIIKSGLFPANNGQIFIDDKSQPIITNILKGTLLLTLEEGLKKINLTEEGILIAKNQQISILLKQS